MTNTDRPTTRVTPAEDAGRPIIIQIQRSTIKFRLKGTRNWYITTIKSCYVHAVRAEILARQAEKKRLRDEKRKKNG